MITLCSFSSAKRAVSSISKTSYVEVVGAGSGIKRALVMVGPVRLDPREPRRCALIIAWAAEHYRGLTKHTPSIQSKSHAQSGASVQIRARPIQTAVRTAAKTSTITDQIDDRSFPRLIATRMLPESQGLSRRIPGSRSPIPPQHDGALSKDIAQQHFFFGPGLISTALLSRVRCGPGWAHEMKHDGCRCKSIRMKPDELFGNVPANVHETSSGYRWLAERHEGYSPLRNGVAERTVDELRARTTWPPGFWW